MSKVHEHASAGDPLPRSGWMERLGAWLAGRVSGASLGIFRIAVGFVMLMEAVTLFRPSASSGGRSHLETYYIGAAGRFHFPYSGFEWLPVLPDWGMRGVGWLLGVGAVLVMLGLFYRVGAVVVFVCWGYLYALESTRTYWMSYYYLELLVTFLMIWLPAANRYSVDALRLGGGERTVPRWALVLLQGQLVATYFHAGVAKLNTDWMLDFMPVRWFLAKPHVAERLDGFLGAGLSAKVKPWLLGEPGAMFFSWAGAVFDLGAGFLLLGRRTRFLGLGLMWIFHGTNHALLFEDIEWFPLVGATTALIFLDPDWPERMAAWLAKPRVRKPDLGWALCGAVALPGVGLLLGWRPGATPVRGGAVSESGGRGRWLAGFCVAWIAFQALFPFRHLLIPGDARMTFEGLSFSWRLKAEVYQSSPARFLVEDAAVLARTNGSVRVDWAKVPGNGILYREVLDDGVAWAELAPILVVTDGARGDRILFNPLSSVAPAADETEARALAVQFWKDLHGRAPAAVHRAVALGQVVDAYANALRTRGAKVEGRREAAQALARDAAGPMFPFMRRTLPFVSAMDADSSVPFLWIDDPVVLPVKAPALPRIVRGQWRNGLATRGRRDAGRVDVGEALVVHRVRFDELGEAAPSPFTLVEPSGAAGPEIRWDMIRDAGVSKSMHVGVNPALARRYARRIAGAWEAATGRRPAVRAITSVSLNERPAMPVVDPQADLASVPNAWFGHDAWRVGVVEGRIPRYSAGGGAAAGGGGR